jgi:hypothetical protein
VTPVGTTSDIDTDVASDGPLLRVDSVHLMLPPATTGVVSSVFEDDRSALVVTVPPTLGLVQAPETDVSHVVSDVTFAVLSTEAPGAVEATTVPSMVTFAVAPLDSVENVQDTSCPVTEQVPVPVATVAVIPVTSDGTVSVTLTFWASDGPWLVDVTVHSIADPATTGAVPSDLVLTSAASVVTVPGTVGLVHAPVISALHGVSEVTVALFVTEVPDAVDGSTTPVTTTVAVVASAIVGNVQATAWPVTVQLPVPEVTVAATPVMLAGTVSAICTFRASEGPLFCELSVHLMADPATTVVVFSTFVLTSPAEVVTVPGALGERQAPVTPESQAVSEVTVAVLATDAPDAAEPSTVPVMTTWAVAPFGRLASEQETLLPVTVHDPVPRASVAFTFEMFAGTTSATVTFAASDGP